VKVRVRFSLWIGAERMLKPTCNCLPGVTIQPCEFMTLSFNPKGIL